MLIVRDIFVAKPGNASKLAKLLKDVMGAHRPVRVCTDYIGDMNHVYMEYEVAELAEFEKMFQDRGTREQMREKMKGYTDLYISGRREILQVI